MKKNLPLLLFILLSLTVTVFAQSKRSLKVDDLFALQDLSDPQISPDGKYVAYVVEKYNAKDDEWQRDLYMVPSSGGQPIQLTSSMKNDSRPRWSPDNKYLAFLSKRDKKTQVFLLNRNGGEAIQLTDVKQGVDDYSWSPDGKKLALVITDKDPDERDEEEGKNDKKAQAPIVVDRLQFVWDTVGFLKNLYSHIYIFDIQSRTMKQITSGPYDDGGPVYAYSAAAPQWSPDGKWLLFTTDRSKDPDLNRNLDLCVVSVDGGEPRKLTTNLAMDTDAHWSPDGKSIVYLTNTKPELIWYEMVKVAVIPAAGGPPKLLTVELDRNCTDPRFSADGKQIYCLLEDHGMQTLAGIPITGGAINRNIAGEKTISHFEVSPNGNIVFLAARPSLPS
jgi:Tol biopolymer transport system component